MDDWRLLYGGAWARVRQALRLSRADGRPIAPVAIGIGAVTWLVTLALAYLGPGGGPMALRQVLEDYGVTVRLLLAVPILLLDEYRVDTRVSILLPGMVASGLFAPGDQDEWQERVRATRHRMTRAATLLVLAGIVVLLVIPTLSNPIRVMAAEWAHGSALGNLSWAGVWYTVVGRPLFLFLGLLWVWRWMSISIFIFKTSRAPLVLQPSHPDKMGGLAIFMEMSTAVMAVIFTGSAVISAEVYYEMAHHGSTLKSFGPILIAYIVLALLVALGPLLSFSRLLARLRRRALFLYGVLASKHSVLFERKWFVKGPPVDELLGASEISSLTDLATAYFVAESIQTVPFGRGTLVTVALAAAAPMIPVVLLEIPLQEILTRLAKFVM
ncbi:MAG TPA: hypothetical protein VFX78_02660 [Candidatus Eisenbacteria bacterium]|nr:hypothetical protein [Candidatus Eisenbacteria bacterium]